MTAPTTTTTGSGTTEGPHEPRLVEVLACQLCGSRAGRLLFREPPHEVMRCRGCGLVWVTPRLTGEALHELYDEGYWRSNTPGEKGYADYAADERLYLKTFRRRRCLVHRYVPRRAKVLDVGCAAGFFLRTMLDAGHEVYGIEPSAAIAPYAVAHLGAERIHVGPLDDSLLAASRPGFEPGTFDLVTMWDVIEHVPDPQSLLRRARALLRPHGYLLLETQNVDSAFARLLGRRWQHFKHEEHLYHFNRATIDLCLRLAGFEMVLNTATCGGKYVAFGFIAERAARLHPAASRLLLPLTLLRGANLYLNFRDEMVVVARPTSVPGG